MSSDGDGRRNRMTSRAANIIRTLYGSEIYPEKRPSLLSRLFSRKKRAPLLKNGKHLAGLRDQRSGLISLNRVVFIFGTAMFVAHFILAVVYYNRLTALEQDVLASVSVVESVIQRRQNIAVNLISAVREYAIHEQAIFTHVSDARTSPPGQPEPRKEISVLAEKGPEPAKAEAGIIEKAMAMFGGSGEENLLTDNKMAGLLALAEQYPDLKLGENFQSYMTALVETEKDLDLAREKHSVAVNAYEKQLKTFPGKLFAQYYGFEDYPHFQANTAARQFEPRESLTADAENQ